MRLHALTSVGGDSGTPARPSFVRNRSKAQMAGSVKMAEPYVMTADGVIVQGIPRFKSVYNPSGKEAMERTYRCASCPASFKRSSHLKVHAKRHLGVRDFSCQYCSKSFVTRSALNAHLKTHTQDQVYQCGECQLTFTTPHSVRRHIVSCHRTARPFICPYCKMTFR